METSFLVFLLLKSCYANDVRAFAHFDEHAMNNFESAWVTRTVHVLLDLLRDTPHHPIINLTVKSASLRS